MKKKILVFLKILTFVIFLSNNVILAKAIDWGTYSFLEAKKILKKDINLNQKDQYGKTPLIWAAMINNDPRIIEILIQAGAYVDLQDKNGLTPLMYAAKNNINYKVIEKLLDSGADINSWSNHNGKTPLMYAVENNNLQVVKTLLKKGADVNYTNFNGVSPLMIASKNTDSRIISILVEAGAKVNIQDIKGRTPLLWAAEFAQNKRIISNLIKYGVNLKITDNNGKGILDYITNNQFINIPTNIKSIQSLKEVFISKDKVEKTVEETNVIDKDISNIKEHKSKYNFRQTNWGMSKNEVLAIENLNLIKESKDILIYKTEVKEYSIFIKYIFNNQNKLVASEYTITDKQKNIKDYLHYYSEFITRLSQEYGKPLKKKLYKTKWYANNTNITLTLNKNRPTISLNINYKKSLKGYPIN